ncbi:hypothetical protein OUZ56_024368 [Daphnia magna]|uniref:Uncharacterized protein n=1 Tax=Daphnia magna TaxID=35525 RepID=A0ABR0B0P0_9CRUS|nr:hypothetical protein OUZ56_024368 [Daphnia magna]
MNLQAQRETVLLKQCRAIRITFATETTSCGPQPRFKNFIIATNGWELARTAHATGESITNGTWEKAEATLLQPERDLPTSFRYDDDNAHDYEAQANDGITTSHMNIIADLAAAMAEQSMKTGINSSTAIRNIIVAAEEKNRNNQLYELVGNLQDHHVLHWSSNHLHHRLQNLPMAWRIQDDMELLLHT